MPVYETTFSVRYAECDAYNHVNHAQYVVYMNEAAFEASAMVGYTVDRLQARNAVWLARSHDIEFIQPLIFGNVVTVKTWVADFKRVRSLRRYDLFAGKTIAARAATDWVFIDTESGRPAAIPAEYVDDYTQLNGNLDTTKDSGPSRTPFPKPPTLAPEPFRYRFKVEWRDVDPQRHVNNAAYFSYLENATWMLLENTGWTLTRLVDRRLAIVTRRYRIEYLAPAFMGDELEVTTWVSDARRATAVRHYIIHRCTDGAVLVRARALWVWVDLATGQPRRIPDDFRSDFQANFTD